MIPFLKKKDNELDKQLNSQDKQHIRDVVATPDQAEQELHMKKNETDDLTRWQQNLKPLIQKMVHELKREYLDEDGDYKPIKDINGKALPPLCSNQMITTLVTQLNSVANQNTMMTKYDERNICENLIAIEKAYVLDIAIPERRVYGTSLHNMSVIKQIFRGYIKPAMFRALHGGERTHQSTIRTIKELRSEGLGEVKEKKRSIFGM